MRRSKPTVFYREIENDKIKDFKDFVGKLDFSFIKPGYLVGIKTHWGESGNITYMSPELTKIIVDKVYELKAKPFVFDTNVLYQGNRRNGIDNLMTAYRHGFSIENLGAPIVVADGIQGHDTINIPAPNRKSVNVSTIINQADAFIVFSHFKGHLVSGFGGALKNLSMGFASRQEKQRMHADVVPVLIDDKMCLSCKMCADNCPVDAITFDPVARFDLDKCIGCAKCIAICPPVAIKVQWGRNGQEFCKKLVETAIAVHNKIEEKVYYINGLINITEHCDCMGQHYPLLIPDIGFTAGYDPVAVDTFSEEIVNEKLVEANKKTLRETYPNVDNIETLQIAESLGNCCCCHNLEKI